MTPPHFAFRLLHSFMPSGVEAALYIVFQKTSRLFAISVSHFLNLANLLCAA